MQRNDMVWKSSVVTKDFLEGMRGAIPLASEQLDVSPWVEHIFDDLFINATLMYKQKHGIGVSREQTALDYHNRPHKEVNILAPLELQCNWLREIGFDHVGCYLKIFELALFGGVYPRD